MESSKVHKRNVVLVGVTLVVLIGGFFFLYRRNLTEKNGDYYYVSLDESHPVVGSINEISIMNNQVTSGQGNQEFNDSMEYKDGVVTIDGKKYARKNSKVYASAKEKVDKFNKDLKQQKSEIKQFKKDFKKQIEVSVDAVFSDFLKSISGTYTGKRVFEFAKTTYNLSITLNGTSLDYSVKEVDNFSPDETIERTSSVKGTVSMEAKENVDADEISVVYGTQLDDSETVDYDIRLNIESALGVENTYGEISSIKEQLDDEELAYTSKEKEKFKKALKQLEELNNWESYQKLTGVNNVVVYYNGTGSKKTEYETQDIDDINQNMTLGILDNGKLELGYTFNSIGGITTETTNELTREK